MEVKVNNDDNDVASKTLNNPSSKIMKTPSSRRRSGHQHALHNSLVEFSFADNLLSSNELTLTRLNALFDRIADRNAMAIRADKLFRLILKTDRNEVTTERFQDILSVETNDNGKIIGRNGILRVVSRGPFLAIFKHESKSFVNSLENVVRSLSTNKKKRKEKKCIKSKTTSDDRGKSAKVSIKSAPVPVCNKLSSTKTLDKPSSSLKRKKSEDKTGMIITTDKDYCDEMSAVSVSPVNCGDGKADHPKNTRVMKSIQESPSKERTLIKSDSMEGILASAKKLSSTKARKKSKSANRSNRSARKQKKKSNHSSATSQTNRPLPFDFDNESQTTASLCLNVDSNHNRNNSALESIKNIREVMNANTTPRENKRLKTYHNPTPVSFSSNFTILPDNFGFHPGYGMTHLHHPLYDVNAMMYPMPYGNHPVMPWHPQAQNESTDETTEDVLCSNGEQDCLIFGSLATFFKRFFKSNHDENALSNKYSHHGGAFITNHQQGVDIGHVPVFPQNNGHWQLPPVKHAYDHRGVFGDIGHLNGTGSSNINKHNRDCGSKKYSQMYDEIFSKSEASSYGETASYMIRSITEGNETESETKDEVSDTSNKLKIYDFKPSIQLPEPENYEIKYSEQSNSSKVSIYSDVQNITTSKTSRGCVVDNRNREPVFLTEKDDVLTEKFNPSIMKFEEASIVTESTQEESTAVPNLDRKSNATIPQKLHFSQTEINVKEKTESSGRRENRTHDQLQNIDQNGKKKLLDSHLRPSKIGESRSISEGKSLTNSRNRNILSLSRGLSVGSSTSSRFDEKVRNGYKYSDKKLLDSHSKPSKIGGSRSTSEGKSSTDSQGGSTLSLSRGSSIGSSTSSTSSRFHDQLQSKKRLLDSHQRPNKIGKSKSVSKGKSSTISQGGSTWSLSRGSSIGSSSSSTSSISSLTGTSDLFPMKRSNSRNTAYHHYR